MDFGTRYLDAKLQERVKPENGLLVLFPSYLSHFQSLYTGDKDRIVVAFNMSVLIINLILLFLVIGQLKINGYNYFQDTIFQTDSALEAPGVGTALQVAVNNTFVQGLHFISYCCINKY